MALADNPLFVTGGSFKPLPRVHLEEHGLKVATLAADDSLDPTQVTLPRLTPLVWDSTHYRAWQDADQRVHVLLAEERVLDLNDDVQANVIIRGQVSYKDIPTPAGQTEATLKAALRAGMRELGIDIADLDKADLPA